ncbi:class II aldolase/adducin family protein [Sphaerimonospora sp. CA-214678]|uniref:class II aldolase/adducin family protein n=1 Tax=Sphaerimonospora sp. CA-214678 TaxID=3240029 RepID=UPI003D8F951E
MSDDRQALTAAAHYLFERGLTHARTGNIALRTDSGILVTPTGTSLRDVRPDHLAVVAPDNTHLDGPAPSKESFLHTAVLRARPHDHAVVHTHSTYSTALSCLTELDPSDAVPSLTAYFAMRVGRVVLLPYHAPGDKSLTATAEAAATGSAALLLRNHGPVVSAPTLDAAVEALEELEHTARLALLLRDAAATPLTPSQRRALRPY